MLTLRPKNCYLTAFLSWLCINCFHCFLKAFLKPLFCSETVFFHSHFLFWSINIQNDKPEVFFGGVNTSNLQNIMPFFFSQMTKHLRFVTIPALIPQKSLPCKALDQHSDLWYSCCSKHQSCQDYVHPSTSHCRPHCTDDNMARAVQPFLGLLENMC